MNLKKIILLAVVFGYGITSLAQSLNLNLKNVSVKKAMTELYQKTGYSFVYEAADLNTSREVTVNATSLEKAIEQILAGQNIDYRIQGKNIIVSQKVSTTPSASKGKGHPVTGKITDSKGEPIIGASVKAKGTNLGTVTDVDGNFSMDVPVGADLEISYVGFRTQTVKSPGKQVSVNLMEDTEALDEVVVIGYGAKKKANLIGAVSTVTANEIKDRPVSSVGQMLQGQVPNLNITFASGTPGESTKLNIRGATSIVNSGAPLVLIDGVEGNIDLVNPNDIESISVLKDAASAAIYGARAGFGVILVTTKNNKDGETHINYNQPLPLTPTLSRMVTKQHDW